MASAARNVCYLLAPLWWIAGLASCTLASDFDVQQCSTSADCDVLSEEIRHCEQSRCVPGCSDNAHCEAFDPRTPLCTQSGGECVALLDPTGGCSVASGYDERELGPLTLEGTDVIGAFATSARSSTWLSLELAADEWNATRRELTATEARPLLLVSCSDGADAVPSGMTHLVEQLGARAIVAPASEAGLRAALEPNVTASPVFLLSPSGASVAPEMAPGAGELLWYLGADYTGALPAYAMLLPRAVATGQARAAEPNQFRVASIIGEGAEDQALSDAVLAQLDVGGLDSARLGLEDRLHPIHPPHELRVDPTSGLEPLLDGPPNLVLLFAGRQDDPTALDPATILQVLEASISARGATPPLYILGPRSLDDSALQGLIAGRPSLRSRVLGVRADPLPSAELAALQQRFLAAYPEAQTRERTLSSVASAYDALYLLAYALFAAPRPQPSRSASDVLAGFRRITAATATEAVLAGPGAEGLQKGLPLLQRGRAIRLDGASGANRFSEGQHTRSGPARIYSIGADGQLLDTDLAAAFANAATTSD